MIDELVKVDTKKHEVILKWQLFNKQGKNYRPEPFMFIEMAQWSYLTYGYKTTTSVFDLPSLDWLLSWPLPYELPFIKIANNRELDWLIGEIPRKYQVYKSVGSWGEWSEDDLDAHTTYLWCVSKYPADIKDYPDLQFLSDHTVGLELYHRNQPLIWEKHYKLPDSTGLDAGDFAITPEELKEIL
jgi:hypothetical protein